MVRCAQRVCTTPDMVRRSRKAQPIASVPRRQQSGRVTAGKKATSRTRRLPRPALTTRTEGFDMAYDFVSEDGLARSNDGSFVANWNATGQRQRIEREHWCRDMRTIGARAVAPDDGWIDRQRNELSIADYADVRSVLRQGDLVALGGPGKWRLVRVDSYRQNPFIPGPEGRIYAFTQIEASS